MQPAHCAERRSRRTRRHHRAGSAEGFAAEALPQLRRLYPAALRLAGDEPDAEELVAETYARAYASLGERGDASITTWLYRNMARAAEEGAAGEGAAGESAAGAGAAGEGATGGSSARDRALTQASDPAGVPQRREQPPRLDEVPGGKVKDALQRVPARSRLAVYLADVEGFSAGTIGRILQMPASRVTSRLRRGHRQLRAALEARA